MFWSACEELDAAVFIHPWDMRQGGRMAPYWFPWLIDMPCETTMAICSLIFGGVLEAHPRLRICLAHAGGVGVHLRVGQLGDPAAEYSFLACYIGLLFLI